MEPVVVINGVRYELDMAQGACVNCAADRNGVCARMPDCEGRSWKLYESQPVDGFPSEAEEEHFKALDAKLNQYDVVEKPKHYMLFEEEGIEVRDVIEKLVAKFGNRGFEVNYPLGATLFESDYVQLMQYLMRFMDKNGVEDLKKARWYLDKMIQAYNAEGAYE